MRRNNQLCRVSRPRAGRREREGDGHLLTRVAIGLWIARQGLNSYEPISQQLVEMDQLHQTQIKRDAVERRHWRKKLGEFRALRSQADQVKIIRVQ